MRSRGTSVYAIPMWNSRASTGDVGVTADESLNNLRVLDMRSLSWENLEAIRRAGLVTALGMIEAQHEAVGIMVDNRWTLDRRSRSAPVQRAKRDLCSKAGYLDAKFGWYDAGPSKLRESFDAVVLAHQINCIAMTSGGCSGLDLRPFIG